MADWKDDTNFFWQSKYGYSERYQTLVDGSDALANGGKFVISFRHVASGQEVFFKAFITNYAENFNCSWKPETVYGRTDPIYTFSNTTRVVNFAFDVPASSEQEAYENMGRLQKLAQMTYPTYENTGDDQNPQYLITQSPLVRIKIMNLVAKNARPPEARRYDLMGDNKVTRSSLYGKYRSTGNPDATGGLLATINNLAFSTDFANKSIFEVGPNVVLPQNFGVTVDFAVIHEKTIGWDTEGKALSPGTPWDVELKDPTWKEKVFSRASYKKRVQMTRDQQAAEDIANARFAGALGGRRAQRAINRYERRKGKGKANDFDEHLANEAQSYLDGTEG